VKEVIEMKIINLDLPKYDHLVLVAEGIIRVYEYLTIQAQYDLAHDTLCHELTSKRYREIEPYKSEY